MTSQRSALQVAGYVRKRWSRRPGPASRESLPISRSELRERWRAEKQNIARRVFRARPHISLLEWAEKNRRWADNSPYRVDQTPHLREILEAYSDPAIEEITIMKPSQSGVTEGFILNAVGYHMDQEPRALMVVIPSVDEAEKWSKKKLQPMVDATSCLQNKLEEGSRKESNTILEKAFAGGSLGIVGSNSGRGFRMVTIGSVFGDDVDGWDDTAGKGAQNEGDQVTLIRRRTDRVPDRKLAWVSTPTMVGRRIHTLYKRMERRGRLHVPCPHCGEMQVLRWGGQDTAYGIKWEQLQVDDDYELEPGEILRGNVVHRPWTAYYLCEANGCIIEEDDKPDMEAAGDYLADDGERVRLPGFRSIGLWFNALTITLPGSEWGSYVREFLEIKDDPDALRGFWNLVLAEPWEDRRKTIEPTVLQNRLAIYPAEVPDGVGVLTAMVDVQQNRLEVQVVGWGIREEAWAIAHHRIFGDPEQRLEVWQVLEGIRNREWKCANGGTMRISVMGVDEGYLLPRVHDFVKGKEAAGVYAFDGVGGHRDYTLRRLKKPNRRGVRPWKVAVDRFKDVYFRRLQVESAGPGYLHFVKPPEFPAEGTDIVVSMGFDTDYFEQLVAEEPVWSRSGGSLRRTYRKVKAGAPNEGLDLWIGCMAGLHTIPRIAERLPEMVAAARDAKPAQARSGRRKKLKMRPRTGGLK